MNTGNWSFISAPAKDLVLKMLAVDPSRRPNAIQVVNHPWIQNRYSLPSHSIPIDCQPSALKVRHTPAAHHKKNASWPAVGLGQVRALWV